MQDRYHYEEVGGFVVDNWDYGAIITSIKHQRLGHFIVDLLNQHQRETNEKEQEIRKLREYIKERYDEDV